MSDAALGAEIFFVFVLKDFIYLLLERGEEREKERERNIEVWEIHQSVASLTPPTGYLAGNQGMSPDWKSNWHPCGLHSVYGATPARTELRI